jgi:hypothetical protein
VKTQILCPNLNMVSLLDEVFSGAFSGSLSANTEKK